MSNRRHACDEPSLFETITATKDDLKPSMKKLAELKIVSLSR